MKRTILTLSALLLSTVGALAQTWNFNNEPQIDATATRYLVDTTSVNYSNLTGADQTWDYSQLGGYLDNQRILTVSDASAYVDIFPNATHLQSIPGFMNTIYVYETNNDKVAHGYEFELPDFGIVQFIFDDYQKMLQFPMTMGSSFSDNLNGTLMLMEEPNAAEGSTFVIADGSGTLKLANNVNHTGVLRIHTQDTIYAEIQLTGLPIPTSATIVRSQYDYVKSGTNFPLFTHATLLVINPLIGQIKVSVVLSAENPTVFVGTEVFDLNHFTVYPNPSSGEIAIQLPIENENATLVITDLAGSTIYSNSNYSNQTNIDLSTVPAGIYFVQVEQNGNIRTEKFIKK